MGVFVKGLKVSIDLLFGRAQHVSLLTQRLNRLVGGKVIPQNLSVLQEFCMFKGLLDFISMKAATGGYHSLALFLIQHHISPILDITRSKYKDVEYPMPPLNYLLDRNN